MPPFPITSPDIMLSLSPQELPEVTAEQELSIAMDLAHLYAAYLNDTQQTFLETIAETLVQNHGIDPHSDLGRDLIFDVCRKVDFQITLNGSNYTQ
jgi:hypothetical protein